MAGAGEGCPRPTARRTLTVPATRPLTWTMSNGSLSAISRVRLLSSAHRAEARTTAAAPPAIAGLPGVQPRTTPASAMMTAATAIRGPRCSPKTTPARMTVRTTSRLSRSAVVVAGLRASPQRSSGGARMPPNRTTPDRIDRSRGVSARPVVGRPRQDDPRQAQEQAGAEVQEPGEEQRLHVVEEQPREQGAEPEAERGDQRVEDRHDGAPPLYSTARLARVRVMSSLAERPAAPIRAPRGTALSCKAGRRKRRSGC